jgi:hypothetical protein
MKQKDRDNRLLRSVIKAVASLHRTLYRASGGRAGANWANDRMPVLLLTTTGRPREGAPAKNGPGRSATCATAKPTLSSPPTGACPLTRPGTTT